MADWPHKEKVLKGKSGFVLSQYGDYLGYDNEFSTLVLRVLPKTSSVLGGMF